MRRSHGENQRAMDLGWSTGAFGTCAVLAALALTGNLDLGSSSNNSANFAAVQHRLDPIIGTYSLDTQATRSDSGHLRTLNYDARTGRITPAERASISAAQQLVKQDKGVDQEAYTVFSLAATSFQGESGVSTAIRDAYADMNAAQSNIPGHAGPGEG